MNPLVLVVAGCGAAIAGAFVVGLLIAMARRKRALRTAPAEGQVWTPSLHQDRLRLLVRLHRGVEESSSQPQPDARS